jgi:RNA polymerase sigma-70 factor (ECF subfamily)
MSDFSQYGEMDLVGLLKTGDRAAFSEIYKRYWHLLFLHAYKMIKNEDEAKDAVQEIFISLWNNRETLNITSNLKGYLYVTVRNRILNKIRQTKSSDDFLDLLAREMNESDESTLQLINEKELIELIDNEVNLLPPRMKQVFQMSRKDFLSHKEIAEMLGTSEETVKKQISRSLKILRTKVDKFGGLSFLLLEFLSHKK